MKKLFWLSIIALSFLVIFLSGTTYNTVDVTPKAVDTSPTSSLTFTSDVISGKKNINYLNLQGSEVIMLVGEIGENTASVPEQITVASKKGKPIYLLIDSPGGSVLSGAMILSAIEASKVPVNTICLGICASMAAITFEWGTTRLMVDRSILMFHSASGGLQGELPHMQSRLTMLSRFLDKIDNTIAKRVGLDMDKFRVSQMKELWLDAEDAINQKFADKLVNIHVDEPAVNIFSTSPPGKQFKDRFDIKWE